MKYEISNKNYWRKFEIYIQRDSGKGIKKEKEKLNKLTSPKISRFSNTLINKRSMGNIAHQLRKQFKSINTYDYIITLIKRRKNPLFTLYEFSGSSFEQTWIPFIQECIVPSLVEISPAVLEKRVFKFCQCICYFEIIFHWKKVWLFIWTNLNPHYPRMVCANLGGN